MTFEQIEYFIAIVKSDTFFDAAESLHTTQSNISKQIKKLEKELDVSLFDRSRHSAALTDAGKEFYLDAQKLYQIYKQTLANMQKFQTKSANMLRIGTLPILTQYSLTSIIKKFMEQHPQINLSLTKAEEPINRLLQNLFALYKVDFSFVNIFYIMGSQNFHSWNPCL